VTSTTSAAVTVISRLSAPLGVLSVSALSSLLFSRDVTAPRQSAPLRQRPHVVTSLLPYFFLRFFGSAQEFDGARILSRFLKNDKFCFCDRHALRFEQQVGEIFVAASPSKKGFDVSVDGFHNPETYFGAAVIQDSVQVIR
jgi:hypothetical protein